MEPGIGQVRLEIARAERVDPLKSVEQGGQLTRREGRAEGSARQPFVNDHRQGHDRAAFVQAERLGREVQAGRVQQAQAGILLGGPASLVNDTQLARIVYPTGLDANNICYPEGTSGLGETCEDGLDCQSGLVCTSPDAVCREICYTDEDCTVGRCAAETIGLYGYCY